MQEGFRQCHGLQCGYCTPGMVMAATGLIDERAATLTDDEIREGLEGNLCRCTGYEMIVARSAGRPSTRARPGVTSRSSGRASEVVAEQCDGLMDDPSVTHPERVDCRRR